MYYIIIASIVIYSIRTLLMLWGSITEKSKTSKIRKDNYQPFVSVIVPARNEEQNIEACVHSIMKSTYPPNQFELIVVNDRSSDNTANILNKLSEEYDNLKIITVTEQNRNKNLQGKPGASHAGILQAKGEIILMTDADCEVNSYWIESIVQFYKDENIGLVAAFTLLNGNRLFDTIQGIEWIYLHTMASAGVGLNVPLGCYGNNLSIRKNVYDKIGGYENIKFSVTEDLSLLQAVVKNGYKVHYVCSAESTVTTKPCKTIKEYISQHRRWATGGLTLGWIAAIFILTGVSIWTGLIVAIASGKVLWAFAVLFTRIIGDYAIIDSTMWRLQSNTGVASRNWLLPAVIFFIIIELIIPFTLLNKKIVWKGQTFSK